jgi:hypothetical protein
VLELRLRGEAAMKYELTREGYGMQISRTEIERPEAIDMLVYRGVAPASAETLFDTLPCGIAITFHGVDTDKYTILRLA